MSWASSDRRSRLPADWPRRRKRVLERDGYRCVLCGDHATEVDHINRLAGDDLSNLRSLCSKCHGRKSASEGWTERWRKIKANDKRFRRTEDHPGLL